MARNLIAAILILLFQVDSIFAATLSDIQNSRFETAITYLEQNNIIDGYPDGTFKPQNNINRAELMKILVNSAGFDPSPSEYQNCFPDVKTDWYARFVCKAKELNWIQGYPDGTFKPAQTINKVETIKMIVNSQQIKDETEEPNYTDINKSEWYYPYIKTASSSNILIETGSYLRPADIVTREEVAENIYRAILVNQNEIDEYIESIPETGLVIWANEGGDKVTKDELRASLNPAQVTNSVWDGETIKIFGAKNEIVNFNLILESETQTASNIQISFDELVGPNNSKIESKSTSDPFNWTQKDIELFFVKYLEIKGLSVFMGDQYDQRHLPEKLRTTHTSLGSPTGTWFDRPNHNKLYPEIAVPLELENGFTIPESENQSIWTDIYIAKDKPAGLYKGEISIKEQNSTTQIPIELTVYNFTLPDEPASQTMLYLGDGDINERYIGERWPSNSTNQSLPDQIRDKHFQLAHRHKISLIDSHSSADSPSDSWIPRLDGSLFTQSNNYRGPGENTGNNVYSIGTYGSASWQYNGDAAINEHVNAWQNWFEANFPETERFLYLIDESSNYSQIESWAKAIQNASSPGNSLMSLATLSITNAKNLTPTLDIPTSTMTVAPNSITQEAANQFINDPTKKFYMYNGGRPASGSFMTDDDGIALRELAWGQYKKQIDRWFFWESTYYNDFHSNKGQTNVFEEARTFGTITGQSDLLGETGLGYSNGNGVLFYPGTDKIYPEVSYDIDGPIASLRLKHWRRGIQDVDYLYLASQINPTKTEQIINEIIPKVLWEYDVSDPSDPTWVQTEISWSDDPDIWEQARKELAEIISSSN